MKKTNVTGNTKRQLIKKSSTTIVIAAALAAVVVSFSVVIANYLWNLSGHYSRVESIKSEASAILEQNANSIEQLQANFNIFEAGEVKSNVILDALPSKYDFPALASTVELLVSSSGLSLENFNGEDVEVQAMQSATQPAPVEVQFTLGVIGSYKDIKELVNNIDHTIRPMKITKIELAGADSSMKATISLITYYQPSTSLEVETRTIE